MVNNSFWVLAIKLTAPISGNYWGKDDKFFILTTKKNNDFCLVGPSGEAFWGILEASWAVLEPSWGVMGASWAEVGGFWSGLGRSWGGFWRHSGTWVE